MLTNSDFLQKQFRKTSNQFQKYFNIYSNNIQFYSKGRRIFGNTDRIDKLLKNDVSNLIIPSPDSEFMEFLDYASHRNDLIKGKVYLNTV